jgi:hypothetical protein
MRNDRKIRVPEADTMPFERWTAYMWTILIIKGLTKTHYLCTNNGETIKYGWSNRCSSPVLTTKNKQHDKTINKKVYDN